MGIFSVFSNKKQHDDLDKGLEKTRQNVFSKISKAVVGKSKVDDEVLDNLEEALVTSDVGVATTLKIIERIEARVAKDKYLGTDELNSMLQLALGAIAVLYILQILTTSKTTRNIVAKSLNQDK